MESPVEVHETSSSESIQPSPRRVTFYLVLTSLVCVAGSSFQFGYNLVVINAPEKVIRAHFANASGFTDFMWSVIVSIFAFAGMFGALCGPHLAARIGRNRTLMVNTVFVMVGSLLLAISKPTETYWLLLVGRILVGFNAGVNTVVAPMYLSEIAPISLRGSLGTMNQFGIVSGILISQILGLTYVLGTEAAWPFLFATSGIVGAVQLFLLPLCPESPRYQLIVENKEEAAIAGLRKFRGCDDVSADIDEMKIEAEKQNKEKRISILELFTTRDLRRPLIISVVMQMSQQLSGINGVLFYSTDMFSKLNLSTAKSQAATCGVGAVSVVMTAIVIFLVERKGRRFLMLVGLAGMAIFYALITITFVYVDKNEDWAKYGSIVLTLLLVVFFQLGPGPIPWFIVAELFSQGPLPAAISVSGIVNWFSGFLVGLIFQSIQKLLFPYTFLPFMVLVILFFIFTYFYVPETKGRTVDNIMDDFRGPKNDHEEIGDTSPVKKFSKGASEETQLIEPS